MRRSRPASNERFHSSDDDTIIIDAEIVDSWLDVADARGKGVWPEVESLLNTLEHTNPWRVKMARRAIRWLRHEALAYHLPWGKEMNSYGPAEK